MAHAAWEERLVILQFAGELLVPCVLAFALPSRLRLPTLVVLGAAAFAAICFFAYRAGLVENGGDLAGGASDLALVVAVNAIHFVPLWTLGAVVGWQIKTRRSRNARSLET